MSGVVNDNNTINRVIDECGIAVQATDSSWHGGLRSWQFDIEVEQVLIRLGFHLDDVSFHELFDEVDGDGDGHSTSTMKPRPNPWPLHPDPALPWPLHPALTRPSP